MDELLAFQLLINTLFLDFVVFIFILSFTGQVVQDFPVTTSTVCTRCNCNLLFALAYLRVVEDDSLRWSFKGREQSKANNQKGCQVDKEVKEYFALLESYSKKPR